MDAGDSETGADSDTHRPTGEEYFRTRFPYDPEKEDLWEAVAAHVERRIEIDGPVLDVGAGYCYFVNAVSAPRKFAIDRYGYPLAYASEDVEAIVGDATDLSLEADSVDVVFASNLLEHLPTDGIFEALAEFRRVLEADGSLVVVTPNFALAPREYFHDYTHETILTHRSLSDMLEAAGFEVVDREVRFLPYSTQGRLPVHPALVRLYLWLPVSPLAGQSLLVADMS